MNRCHPYLPHYKPPTALSHMHHLTCGISSLLHSVNLILFTVLLVHLILCISPHHSHHLHSHHLSLPLPSTPDLKLISFTNPFLHSHSYSFRTDFTDLNLYWIKGALFVCLVSGYTCARLSCILSFWVHVNLFYRIVSYRKCQVGRWDDDGPVYTSSEDRQSLGCNDGRH